MTYLVIALLAPLAGPVLYRALHPHPRASRLVDGFVYLAVPALVGWQVLIHAWDERAILPIVLLALGLLVPNALERFSHELEERTDDLAIAIWMAALCLHAVLEGASFAAPETVSTAFALAVILHRIPVGLVIWWLIRPRHGIPLALTGVVALVATTAVGYVAGAEILGPLGGHAVELLQAFVGGTLIHVVFHQGRHDHQHCSTSSR